MCSLVPHACIHCVWVNESSWLPLNQNGNEDCKGIETAFLSRIREGDRKRQSCKWG